MASNIQRMVEGEASPESIIAVVRANGYPSLADTLEAVTSDTAKAREIAGWWHGGQWSPLYAFASSGHVNRETLREARECLRDVNPSHTRDDIRHLHVLIAYLERVGDDE